MTEEITFETEADMPPLPMSLGTTLVNKTGSWRYIRPLYVDKTSPCNHACPAGEDIVEQIGLMAEGRFEEAWRRLMEENPLPGVCGRICPHVCERECNRKEMGGAIAIHLLEQFLAHYGASHEISLPKPEARRQGRVAIVGAGACGLSAAYFLVRLGYRVTLFEAQDEPGGRMCLVRGNRLPKEVLKHEIAQITALGMEVRTGMLLGANLALKDLEGFDAVLLALGHTRSRKTAIEAVGLTGPDVELEFLKSGWGLKLDEKGLAVTDEAACTGREGVFAAGEMVLGAGPVSRAVGSGKRTALAIDKYLKGVPLEGFPPLDGNIQAKPRKVDPTVVHFKDINTAYFEWLEPPPKPETGIFGEETAKMEAERCFSCGTCNLCDTCFIFCPDVAISRVDHRGYEVNYDYCKGCGVCAEECPRHAISMERE